MRSVLLAACLVLAAGCASEGEASRTSATVPVETTVGSVEREVEAAYLRSWDVYARGVRTLSKDGFEDVFAEGYLEVVASEVDDLRAAGHAALVSVEHNYEIEVLSPVRARIVDRYVNHSVLTNAATGAPLEEDPNEVLEETYELRLLEGRWKVVAVSRS